MSRFVDSIGHGILWLVLVTGSVLLHEVGHALAYRFYGAEPSISMHGLGGVTFGKNARHLTAKQRIVVSSAGSVFEMVALGGPAWLLQQTWSPGGLAGLTLYWLVWINVVWALINLAPVWPMDGGRILDDAFFVFTNEYKRPLVHKISIVMSVILCAYFWKQGLVFAILLFLYNIYLNVNGLGVSGGGTGPALHRLGGSGTDVGGDKEPRRRRGSSRGDQVQRGFDALRRRRSSTALEVSKSILDASPSRDLSTIATELTVWAWLQQGRLDSAQQAFAGMNRPSRSLSAIMRIESGEDRAGVHDLADAVVGEAGLPNPDIALLHVSQSGHLRLLIENLQERGPSGRGYCVQIQMLFEALSLDDELESVAGIL